MGIIDKATNRLLEPIARRLEQPVVKGIQDALRGEMDTPAAPADLAKSSFDTLAYQVGGKGVRRYQFDYSNQDMNMRRKPQSGLSFQLLRQFSVTHEITRACINARKRQITGLQWDIVPSDAEDKNDYSTVIPEVVEFFKNLGGYKVRFRSMIDQVVEDLMALDAVALYRTRNRAGDILYYTPLDAATIKLRLDEIGNVPEPPEIAYKQIVRGQIVAELTTDDLIYDMVNSRSSSPYGLAPLESLIIIVSSALKSNLYNLNYLTDGNIPEGIITLPPEWSANQIKEYQEVWDAYMGGDARATSRLRFVPGGQSYTPTKKPQDMAFEQFNLWLLKVTCALFDVQPQEIGFTEHQSTRANASEQTHIQQKRGEKPLANFLQELFTDIIQHDLGFKQLKFEFLGLEDKDELQEAQTIAARVTAGLTTIDEERKDLGLEPIGIDQPFVSTGQPIFLASAFQAQSATAADPTSGPLQESAVQSNDDGSSSQKKPDDLGQNTTQNSKPAGEHQVSGSNVRTTEQASAGHGDQSSNPNYKGVDVVTLGNELRKLRSYAINRLKDGKILRPFESEVLPDGVVSEINKRLLVAKTPDDARTIIDEYRQDYQVDLIAATLELKQQLAKVV